METVQRGDFDKISEARLNRARVQAIAFGIISGLALICVVYSFLLNQKLKNQTNQLEAKDIKISELTSQLQKCRESK
jgi:hypothetical protein